MQTRDISGADAFFRQRRGRFLDSRARSCAGSGHPGSIAEGFYFALRWWWSGLGFFPPRGSGETWRVFGRVSDYWQMGILDCYLNARDVGLEIICTYRDASARTRADTRAEYGLICYTVDIFW